MYADMSCFQGLFFCPEAASLLLHNFCIYHISPPGHEVCILLASEILVTLDLFYLVFSHFLHSLLLNAIIYILYALLQEFLQLGAAAICQEEPVPCVDDLADQILEVLNHFR